MRKRFLSTMVASFACAALLCSCGGDSGSSSVEDEPGVESSSSEEQDNPGDNQDKSSSSVADKKGSSSSSTAGSKDDKGGDSGEGQSHVDDPQQTVASSSSVAKEPTSKKACASLSDADEATLEELNRSTLNLLNDFVKTDLNTMAPAADNKAAYKKLMKTYNSNGNSCPAITLGYGVAFLEDVLNSDDVKNLRFVYDNYNVVSWRTVNDDFVTTWLKTLQQTSSALGDGFTEASQKVLRNTVIPSLDSAIKYYEGIVSIGDYEYVLEDDEYLVQVDQSDFALALGSMYAMKALFTAVSSVNLNFTKDGSYKWVDDYNSINGYSYRYTDAQVEAMQHVVNMLAGKTGLTAVISGREEAWKSVPSILLKATQNFRKGLQHSLNDEDQDYDMFVVGDDADADFSSGKIQQFIHAVDGAEDALTGNYAFEYKDGKSVTVNLQKFFSQTDGFMKYLPKMECDEKDCYFLDLKGNRTISLNDSRHGYFGEGNEARYFYFQDPTFGGVFPRISQNSLWDFINYVVDKYNR